MKYTENVCRLIRLYLKTDRDFVILVTGKEGSGKSTLAVQLAMLIDPGFNIQADVLYSFNDVVARLNSVQPFSCLVMDEAVELAFSRNAMRNEQKKMIQIFMQIRQKNICFILLIPNIADLDKYFKGWRGDRWVDVVARGQHIWHEMTRNRYSGDIFWEQKFMDTFRQLNGEHWATYLQTKKEAFERMRQERMKRGRPLLTRYHHECPKCSYSWSSTKMEVRLCPNCRYRLYKINNIKIGEEPPPPTATNDVGDSFTRNTKPGNRNTPAGDTPMVVG